MDNFLNKLPPIMIGYIVALPILIASLKLESDRIMNIKYQKALFRVLNITFLGLWFFVENVFSYYELMENTSAWMMLFVYLPSIVLLFLLICNLPKRSDNENNSVPFKKIYGFSRNGLAILGMTLLVAIILIILGTIKSSSIVMDHHKQFFEELASSENKEEVLYHETYKSASWLSLTTDRINYIKNNPAYVSSVLPWKMEVTVGSKSDNVSTHLVLTYVRDGRAWILNGIEEEKTKSRGWFDVRPGW
ncbi:hypothetical protein SAMN02745823_01008 [Sporobacter termitidis DSM 10068]|uniref:Uncharacterized protein n=1 Tax=Sporobacter termitidis DSM 10068 TaxID=1123282 RepID=A0A1M5VT25_9FIRM|nr:hypothetical protein [Sporobacter termitidis]SHH78340.1 hypothetical protein SAMN02745823_01008 [Sporobacter termitidis DSM 10068]